MGATAERERAAGNDGWSRTDLMIVAAARALADGEVVFVGIGLPNLACNLARRLHAPKLQLVYESGVFGAAPERQPLSIGDPCLVSGAVSTCGLVEIFLFYLHRGLIDVGFLGGAQVDRHGSINTTVIGRYDRPKVRLPGSGGASEIAALARRVFIIGRQSTQSFVEKLDFTTSPGRLADGQRPAGAPGGGPELVITDLGTYRFDGRGEMTVATLHPGVSPDEVRANTGWDIAIPSNWETTPPPTAVELEALGQIT